MPESPGQLLDSCYFGFVPVLTNPNHGPDGNSNVILAGNGRFHYVRDYPGPLSIKSIVRGRASWSTQEGQFEMDADSLLILNNRQPYTMLLDAPRPVRTFCLFFRDGLIEDAWRCETNGTTALLDDPWADLASLGFFERMHPKQGRISTLLASMYRELTAGEASDESLEDGFLHIARELLRFRSDLKSASARVPASKPSTKAELFRRLTRARSIIEASLDKPLDLETIARESFLSPFHLHRLYSRVFGETPHRYAVRRRMDRARRLLANSEMPVTDVCLETGFQSLGSFSTLFRRENGCSPQQYRSASLRK